MKGYEISGYAPIKRDNLEPQRYTLSLLKEGFKAGLIGRQEILAIQEQVMLILRDLIMRYTGGESASVRTETAESLLNSVYYCIDAYTSSFEDPAAGIEALKRENIKYIYDKGVEILEEIFKEAEQLWVEIVKDKLDVPLEVYNTSVTEALPEFFKSYSIVFGAHDTACSLDYPLIFDDMNVKGVFYIKNYLEHLHIETHFCRFFDKRDIDKILVLYGRRCKIDYKESPVNLFEILLNNSLFSVLSGKSAKELSVTGVQFGIICSKLSGTDHAQIRDLLAAAAGRMIEELGIERKPLEEYIYSYIESLSPRVLNAVRNNSLDNIVMVSGEAAYRRGEGTFLESERMSDESFRLMMRKIADCTSTGGKVDIILRSVKSLEDFIDVLNADCLYGDEIEAVLAALSDTERAILEKAAFTGELREYAWDGDIEHK